MAFRILPGALDAARDGMIPGGLINNRDFIGDCVEFADSVAEEYRAILFDPQTAGGLLVAVKESASDGTQQILKNHGITSDRVGRVLSKRSPLISVR
jgi:selenide,water dikinase